MEQTKTIKISDYNYNLPDQSIAKFPLKNRDESKLLIYRDGAISDDISKNIGHHLPDNSLLISNNTKVVQARLFFKKQTGAIIEVFCLTPVDPEKYEDVFIAKNSCSWKCMIGNRKKWKNDPIYLKIPTEGSEVLLQAKLIDSENNIVNFTWDTPFTFGEILTRIGETPIPPYLNRKPQESDKLNYQTVYAKNDGSVAAPTAGLHFTHETFEKLTQNNIQIKEVTLHVGAGTFQPVKAENALHHPMHAEYCVVHKDLIKALNEAEENIFAVGTTSSRTLESLYWLGVGLMNNDYEITAPIHLDQYVYTQNKHTPPLKEVTQFLIHELERYQLTEITFFTSIMITPGYHFRVINGLITNFHQPKSTLLLLIAAFIGEDWRKIYEYALKHNFRFLSYGDSSLLFRSKG